MRNTQTQKEGIENSDAKNRKKVVRKPVNHDIHSITSIFIHIILGSVVH